MPDDNALTPETLRVWLKSTENWLDATGIEHITENYPYLERRVVVKILAAWEADCKRIEALERRLMRGLWILDAADHQHYVQDAIQALRGEEER